MSTRVFVYCINCSLCLLGSHLWGRKLGVENVYMLNMESLHSHCLGEVIMFLFLGNAFLFFLKLSFRIRHVCCSSLISCMRIIYRGKLIYSWADPYAERFFHTCLIKHWAAIVNLAFICTTSYMPVIWKDAVIFAWCSTTSFINHLFILRASQCISYISDGCYLTKQHYMVCLMLFSLFSFHS